MEVEPALFCLWGTSMIEQIVTLDLNNGEPVARAILPETKRQKQRLHKIPGIRQFWRQSRIGYNDVFCCWCGGTIEIDFSVRPGTTLQESIDLMNARVSQFDTAHEACLPTGQEES